MRVIPTAHALHLRSFAARLVPHLARRGEPTVAITGSAARGDAVASSDLDLWVLGPHSDRQHLTIAGVPVTLLRQRPREALSLDSLCLFEVADALVLSDPRGELAAVKRAARQRRAEVRKAVLEATWDGVRRDARLLVDASHWQRTLALREIAYRLASTWLYLRFGWRVPRLRALRAWLPVKERRLFEGILGMPMAKRRVQGAIAALPTATRAAQRLVGRRRRLPEQPPPQLFVCHDAGAWDEAALLGRRFLHRELLPPLRTALGLTDVTELAARPGGRAVLDAIQRFQGLKKETRSEPVRRKVALLATGLRLPLPRDVRAMVT